MPDHTTDDSSCRVATLEDASYSGLFNPSLGEVDFKDLIANNEVIYVNLPQGSLSPHLAGMLNTLLMSDIGTAKGDEPPTGSHNA
ncbi:hypothetical protein V0M98_37600 (plasmid) [Pseudomonas silesiensis]|uniref:hypothetical protein n=1 Tax=Pseudomonas silesiensis TaxID=1853130 RepID=UPI0030CCFF8D